MNSQEDMFGTQDTPKSKLHYDFVVLCDRDPEVMSPFALYPRSMFSTSEILDRWLDSILDHSSRLKPLHTLHGLQDKNLSLFGKIEEGLHKKIIFHIMICNLIIYNLGVPKEEVHAKVDSLNFQYHKMRTGGETQLSSLLNLVAKNPYRLMSRPNKKVCPGISLIFLHFIPIF